MQFMESRFGHDLWPLNFMATRSEMPTLEYRRDALSEISSDRMVSSDLMGHEAAMGRFDNPI